MAKLSIYKIADYAIIGLSVFLVFCLVFESYIELPNLVGWLGRWHPLILHFPIVLIIICVYLSLLKKNLPKTLLLIATLSVLITAISGFFLGHESQPKGHLLFWHQWLGATTALLTVIWFWLYTYLLSQKAYTKIIQIVIVVLVGITGHYGGMVTHGEDFLAFPKTNKEKEITENALIYAEIIQPIFNDKCLKCHNPNKQKGELLMTDYKNLIIGGKSGQTIIPNNPENSELLVRLHLPKTDKKHMPPEGETSLTSREIELIERWVSLEASDTLRLNQLTAGEPIFNLLESDKSSKNNDKWNYLKTIDDDFLATLNSNYYVTIQKIIGSKQALSVNVFNPPKYEPQYILDLKPLTENIIELDVSGIPLGKTEIDFISTLKNLERLEIDKTPVTDSDIETLSKLQKLNALKVYSSKISDKSIDVFKKWKSLKTLHVWNTQMTSKGFKRLQSEFPNLELNRGVEDQVIQFFNSKDEKVSIQKQDSIASILDSIINSFEKPIKTR